MRYFSLANIKKAISAITRPDIDPAYSVPDKPTVLLFPFPEGKTTQAYPAIGVFWKLTAGAKQHVVGFCRRLDLPTGDECYFPICGPEFMKESWDAATSERRIKEAVRNLPTGVTAATFRGTLKDAVGFAKGESPCAFWKDFNSQAKTLGCKHVATVAWNLSQGSKIGTVLALLDTVVATGVTTTADTEEAMQETFSRVCPPSPKGRKFPVLIQGEHGGGKTYGAREFGETAGFDAVIECHGHAGIEAVDFLGGMLPLDGDRSMVWVDGPVSEAFRRAAKGQKVLLIADEIYRVPRRERSLFLTALSPAKKADGSLVYRLKTGRPIRATETDMMPTLEMIEAPEKNISIIATTNIGPGYDIEDDDPAEASRWHKIHYIAGETKRANILSGECKTLGFPESLTGNLLLFMKNVRKLRSDGEAKLAPSIRELVRALHISADGSSVEDTLKDMAHCWAGINTDGEPNEEQVKAIKAAARASFK